MLKAKVRRNFLHAAIGGAALGTLGAGVPAHAQFVTGVTTGLTRRVVRHGQVVSIPAYTNVVSISPYTVFQFNSPSRNPGNGLVTTTHSTEVGPFLQYEKNFDVEQFRHSSTSIGAWYWYHGGSGDRNTRDRYALYTTYNFSQNVGAEVNAGGSTAIGFTEYYGFLLYRVLPPTRLHSRFSVVQLGAGPYFPRSGYGNTGFTGTLGTVYDLTSTLTASASVWYVNYNAPARDFGSNFSTHNNVTRLNLSVNLKF